MLRKPFTLHRPLPRTPGAPKPKLRVEDLPVVDAGVLYKYSPFTLNDPAPELYTLGEPNGEPHPPKLRPGARQHEELIAPGERVRVLADYKEVWRYFMYIGGTEDWVKRQARGLGLREFLEQYVRHGMRINDPLPYGVRILKVL